MAGSIFVRPKAAPISSSGAPYAGAKYYFYATGTSTLQSVYTDSALTTPHANPVVADGTGTFAPIWLDPTKTYRAKLTTAAGVLLEDVDPVDTKASSASLAFLQAGTGAVARYAQDKMRDVVSVMDFGAKGDGATDDTSAIQAALNSAAKQVVFPAGGTFLINGGITVTTTAQKITAYGATIKLKNSASTKWLMQSTATDVVFSGGTWDGNKANGNATGSTYNSFCIGLFGDRSTCQDIDSINTYGIGIKGFANYLSILNNRIRNTTQYGIYLDGSVSVSNTGNRAIGNTIDMSEGGLIGQGILFTAGTGQYQTDWEISDNNILNVDSGTLADQAINIAVRGRRGIVSNNTTRYGSMGFSEGGDQTVISNNRFLDLRGTVRFGIEPSGGETTITGNVVTNALRGVSASGNRTFDHLVISGNRFSSDTTSGYGIYLQIAVGYTGQNCVISANSITGAYAIYLQRDATNTSITGNIITGPGSGVNSRAIYLDTPSTNAYIFVSGNSISKFQRAYAFYSASALTVNHVYAISNNCANDVPASQTWNVEGSATTGTPVVVAWSATPVGFSDSRLDIASSTRFLFGTGTPEAAQTAGVGSIYLRQNGGAGTSFYVKESGTGNTGWVAK